mgnify:CR=1 FL=1
MFDILEEILELVFDGPLMFIGIIYLIMTGLFTKLMRKVEKGMKISD